MGMNFSFEIRRKYLFVTAVVETLHNLLRNKRSLHGKRLEKMSKAHFCSAGDKLFRYKSHQLV